MNIVPSRNLFSTPDNPASHTYGGGEVTMPSLVNGRIKKNNFFSQFDSVGAFATPNEKIDSLVKSGLDRETFQVYGENVNAPPIRTTQARSPNQPYASITSPGHNSNNNNNNSSYIVSGSENSLSNISKPGGYQKKTLAESLSGSGASDREADTPCFLLMSEFRAYAADLFASDEAIMEAVAHACAASTLSILKAQRLASSLGLNVTFGVDTLHYSWNNRTRAIVEEKKGLINLKDAVPFLEGGFSLEQAFFNYNAYFPAFLLCGASHVWINSEDQIATPNDPNVRYTTYVLFAEDLFRALPDFPLAIYLTTGPDLRLVPSPLANVTDLSPASVSHLPPQFRSLPYQTIWSVITLQRFALFMYRWAQCPAGVIETLLLRKKPQETSVTPTGISDYSYVSSQKSRAVAPPPRPVETQVQHPYGIGRPPSLPKTASEQSTRTAIHKYYLMPETEKKRDEQEILDSNLSLPAYTLHPYSVVVPKRPNSAMTRLDFAAAASPLFKESTQGSRWHSSMTELQDVHLPSPVAPPTSNVEVDERPLNGSYSTKSASGQNILIPVPPSSSLSNSIGPHKRRVSLDAPVNVGASPAEFGIIKNLSVTLDGIRVTEEPKALSGKCMPPSRKDTPVTSPIPQSSVTLVEPPQPLSRSGTPTIVIGRRPGSGSDEIKVPDVISRSSPPGSGYRVELSEALGNSAFTIHSSTRSNSVGDKESPIGHSPMRGQGGKFQFPHTSYDGTDVEASGGTLRGSGGVGIAPNVMVYPPPHLVINHDTERGDGGENSRIYLSVSALSKGNLHPSVDTATVLSPTVDSVSVNHTDSTISGRRSIRSPPPSLTGTRIRLLQRIGRAYVARRDMPRKSRKPLGNFKRPQPILRPHFSFSAPPDLDEDSALLTGPVAPKPTAVVIKPPPLTAFSAPSKPTRRPSFEQDMNSSENGGSSYRPKSPVSVSGTICFTTSMAEASPLVASFVNKSIHALQSVSLHERVSSVVDNSVSSHLTKTFKNAAASIRRTRPNTPDIRAKGEAAEVLCRMWLGFVARQRLAKIRQERQEEMALDAQLNILVKEPFAALNSKPAPPSFLPPFAPGRKVSNPVSPPPIVYTPTGPTDNRLSVLSPGEPLFPTNTLANYTVQNTTNKNAGGFYSDSPYTSAMNSARSSLADFPYKKVLITPSGDMNPPSPVIQHKDPPPPAPIPTTSPPCSQPLIPWLMGQSTELVSAPKNAAAGTQLTPMEFSLADMRRSSMRSGGSLYQAFSFSTTTRTNAAFNNTYSVSEFMHNFSVNPKDPWTLDGVTIVETDSDIEEDMSSLSSDQDSDENIATEETDKSMASEEFEKDVINLQLETDNLIPAKQLYKSIDQEKTYSQTDALSLIQRVGRGYLCRRHENFLFMVRVSKEEITLMHRVVKGFLTRRDLGFQSLVYKLANRDLEYWELRNKHAITIQRVIRGFVARQKTKRSQRKLQTRLELRIAAEQVDFDDD